MQGKEVPEALRRYADEYRKKNPPAPEKPPEWGEVDQGGDTVIQMGRGEYEAIKFLQAACAVLRQSIQKIEPRLRQIGAWGTIRMAEGSLRKTTARIMDTVPLARRKQMFKEFDYLTIKIEVGRAGAKDERDQGWTYCPTWAVRELICEAAHQCQLCMKSGAEIRHCDLKKAFDAMTTRDVQNRTGGCPYEDVNMEMEILEDPSIEEDDIHGRPHEDRRA